MDFTIHSQDKPKCKALIPDDAEILTDSNFRWFTITTQMSWDDLRARYGDLALVSICHFEQNNPNRGKKYAREHSTDSVTERTGGDAAGAGEASA